MLKGYYYKVSVKSYEQAKCKEKMLFLNMLNTQISKGQCLVLVNVGYYILPIFKELTCKNRHI